MTLPIQPKEASGPFIVASVGPVPRDLFQEHTYPDFKGDDKKGQREQEAAFRQDQIEKQIAGESLSQALSFAMREKHKMLRQNTFLKSLVTGGHAFCAKAYVAYLCNLWAIHGALEEVQKTIIETHGEGYFVFPNLFRSESLLNDIQLWSLFNETIACKFADEDKNSARFKEHIEFYVHEKTREFVQEIQQLGKENPIAVAGIAFMVYGSVANGGQLFKKGIHKGFIERLEDPGSLYETKLWGRISAEITDNQANIKTYADKSILLFNLNLKEMTQEEFSKIWHENLNQLPDKLQLQGDEKKNFQNKVVELSLHTIDHFLTFIPMMEEDLRTQKI